MPAERLILIANPRGQGRVVLDALQAAGVVSPWHPRSAVYERVQRCIRAGNTRQLA